MAVSELVRIATNYLARNGKHKLAAAVTDEIEQQQKQFARWIGALMDPLDSDQYEALPADLRDWWIVRGAELYRQRLQTKDIGEDMADQYIEAETEHMKGRESEGDND